jgi:hypothetical protein
MAMSRLILASIDVTKIIKSLLYKGKKGTYLHLNIWQNDEPDQYGNEFSIQQTTGKDEPKIFLGNGKYFKKEEQRAASEEPAGDGLPF